VKRLLPYLVLLLFMPLFAAAQKVVSLHIDATINPAIADYIHRGIKSAEEQKASCILIHLNTPGGLLKSTRVIVSDIMQSRVPVVVYVSPGGAHAGSAGVFITMAAHIAAMAPGTNIGAAHPVSSGGAMDTIMSEKVTNDAAAFIRSIAQKRDRNVEWAVNAVRNSVSVSESEALENNIINLVAANEKELLEKIDGKQVITESGTFTLQTKNAAVEIMEMGWVSKLLNVISDPNVAYILFLLGLYGLMFELYSPGTLLPGIIGGICIILALYAMHTLPVNYAGLALIVFAVILFVLELKIISHGLLGIGGVISLFLGSVMLFRTGTDSGFVDISWSVIITTVAITTLFFLFVIGMGLKAQRAKPSTGTEGMIGETGETVSELNPVGRVLVHGEIWNAKTLSGVIAAGEKIRVTAVQNLTLQVEPLS
jgi:membrane-bound serine protease (ClpP class)